MRARDRMPARLGDAGNETRLCTYTISPAVILGARGSEMLFSRLVSPWEAVEHKDRLDMAKRRVVRGREIVARQ